MPSRRVNPGRQYQIHAMGRRFAGTAATIYDQLKYMSRAEEIPLREVCLQVAQELGVALEEPTPGQLLAELHAAGKLAPREKPSDMPVHPGAGFRNRQGAKK